MLNKLAEIYNLKEKKTKKNILNKITNKKVKKQILEYINELIKLSAAKFY